MQQRTEGKLAMIAIVARIFFAFQYAVGMVAVTFGAVFLLLYGGALPIFANSWKQLLVGLVLGPCAGAFSLLQLRAIASSKEWERTRSGDRSVAATAIIATGIAVSAFCGTEYWMWADFYPAYHSLFFIYLLLTLGVILNMVGFLLAQSALPIYAART